MWSKNVVSWTGIEQCITIRVWYITVMCLTISNFKICQQHLKSECNKIITVQSLCDLTQGRTEGHSFPLVMFFPIIRLHKQNHGILSPLLLHRQITSQTFVKSSQLQEVVSTWMPIASSNAKAIPSKSAWNAPEQFHIFQQRQQLLNDCRRQHGTTWCSVKFFTFHGQGKWRWTCCNAKEVFLWLHHWSVLWNRLGQIVKWQTRPTWTTSRCFGMGLQSKTNEIFLWTKKDQTKHSHSSSE